MFLYSFGVSASGNLINGLRIFLKILEYQDGIPSIIIHRASRWLANWLVGSFQ